MKARAGAGPVPIARLAAGALQPDPPDGPLLRRGDVVLAKGALAAARCRFLQSEGRKFGKES